MAKKEHLYSCTQCFTCYAKWSGQCDTCGQWNTIQEHSTLKSTQALQTTQLNAQITTRIITNIKEFNYVTGGGIVPGAVILIGGEPGIGKSTLLLQLCNSFNNTEINSKPLYISGEEAASQVALRAQRLNVDTSSFDAAFGTDLDQILALLNQKNPSLVIIDSIQTMYHKQTESSCGTANQIRACSSLLTDWAKSHNVPLILVGHITKEGSLAGPKLLEHMVDTVLYFEGERTQNCRILRCVKNRFGATDEVGVFQMQENGLQEITNPSQFFINQNHVNAPGLVIFPSIEGTRPVLLELQALTLTSHMQMPRRAVVGWDQTRLSMIAAVIETKLKIRLSQKDIYINIVGGMKISEPAADLAVAMALISAHYSIIIPKNIIIFGEIGLAGEIRTVNAMENRIKEAAKLGFEQILGPIEDSLIKCKTIEDARQWLYNIK